MTLIEVADKVADKVEDQFYGLIVDVEITEFMNGSWRAGAVIEPRDKRRNEIKIFEMEETRERAIEKLTESAWAWAEAYDCKAKETA